MTHCYPLSQSLLACSHRGQLTRVNQTLLQIQKLATTENTCPKFGGSLSIKRGAKELPIWGWFYDNLANFAWIWVGKKQNIPKRKEVFKLQSVPYISIKYGELWWINGWDYILFFTHCHRPTLRQHCNLSANTFGTNKLHTRGEPSLNYKGSPTFQKFGEPWSTDG